MMLMIPANLPIVLTMRQVDSLAKAQYNLLSNLLNKVLPTEISFLPKETSLLAVLETDFHILETAYKAGINQRIASTA